MSLAEQLNQIRAGTVQKVPASILAVMDEATQDLADSGFERNLLSKGEPLPVFELPNQKGEIVRSSDLLNKGPLILTVYRGLW